MSKFQSPEYYSWRSMRARCLNVKDRAYENYGGRGIGICESWSGFDKFFQDMGNRPKGTTLDRIDNDKGYSKDNCRWATRSEQLSNRRPYSSTGEKYIFRNMPDRKNGGFRVKFNGKRKFASTLEKAIALRDEMLEGNE